MSASFHDHDLLAHVDASPPDWIVTRTRRLSRELLLRVAALRAAHGKAVADTPPIRTLDAWVEELGRRVLASEVGGDSARGRILLTGSAEQLLWEKVIGSLPGDQPRELLDVAALAATAADAWQRVCLWGEPPLTPDASEDVEAFRRWLPAFRVRLEAAGLVTRAELVGIVSAAIARGSLDSLLPRQVVVLGFERDDPSLTRLLDALRARNVPVVDVDHDAGAAAQPVVLRTATRAAEVRTVASRIRARLLEDPSLRVAVLAPELASYSTLLERVFEEELDPAGVIDVRGRTSRRFDFAEAPALAAYPLIAGALDILSLDGGTISFETVSRLLLFALPRPRGKTGADPGSERARLDAERTGRGVLEAGLRRSRAARLRLAGGKGSVAVEAAKAGLTDLANRLGALSQNIDEQRGVRRSPGAWRREWIGRLDLAGWPGALDDPVEGLLFRRWRDAMEEFARLEIVEGSMTEAQAVARLRTICGSTPVQPTSEGLSVRVLNLLDASGLEFDLVFVIGMTGTSFPAAPRPNPLLPVAWQRSQPGMPRASVEGERALADAVWKRVLRSAPEILVTWPRTGESGEDNTPSALVAELPSLDAAPQEGEPWWLRAAAPCELRPADELPPPLVRSGGSSILMQQSSCAFRAFVATRLAAERLGKVEPQPDAARRGTLVHRALEKAYTWKPSRGDLQGMSDENVAELARDAAREAVKDDPAFFEHAADLEEVTRAWLAQLVEGWLLYERDHRDDDWTVELTEQPFTLRLPRDAADPLRISFRPDRIDRTGDGIAILDFKTSGTAKKAGLWAGERPDDPQLPLYLVLLEQEGHRVDALAFANLSARDSSSLDGLAASSIGPACGPPSARQRTFPTDYREAVASMRASIETLARDYLASVVTVGPKKLKVCEYCGSQAFCRLSELGGINEEDDSEDEA